MIDSHCNFINTLLRSFKTYRAEAVFLEIVIDGDGLIHIIIVKACLYSLLFTYTVEAGVKNLFFKLCVREELFRVSYVEL